MILNWIKIRYFKSDFNEQIIEIQNVFKMDHLVLIPKDFNLVVKSDKLSQDDVSVFSNRHITQGTIYYPFQGTVRFDRLNVFTLIGDDDVS